MKKITYILIATFAIFITSCTKVVNPPMPTQEITKTDIGTLIINKVVNNGNFTATVTGLTVGSKYSLQIVDINQDVYKNVKVETVNDTYTAGFAVSLKNGAYDVILVDSKANTIGRTPLIIKN
jgi:hypothetical protein